MFIVLFLLFITSNAYDENLTKYVVNLAQSSYMVSDTNQWNCDTCLPTITNEYVTEKEGVRVLQGYDSYTNTLYASYRGSTNIVNWIDNIQIRKVYPYNDTSVGVSKGFYKEYNHVKEQVLNNFETLSTKYELHNLLLTGHSAGASMATLLAYDILTLYPQYNVKFLITFGSPRVGNDDFANKMKNSNIESYRVTHYYDIVPHVPEEILGYLHISNEIWYNEKNSEYSICHDNVKEDDLCSNTCAPTRCTSIDDHLYYLNVTIGS
jgi:hypothetical protein